MPPDLPPMPSLPLETVHEVRDTCLCFATQRAARRLARRFDRAFQPYGITNNQFSLMTALGAPNPPAIGHLAAFLAMDRTTVTAAAKALEKRGLVTVGADAEDRRTRRLRLTEQGRVLMHAALPIWRAEHAAVDREIGLPAADALRKALKVLG
ncbi:MAG: MarR family winged helix-turn-helix transcriptional regulator [Beijerinckiaceae bacterium]